MVLKWLGEVLSCLRECGAAGSRGEDDEGRKRVMKL